MSSCAQAGIKNGAKVMLIGSTSEAIAAAATPKEAAAPAVWDAPAQTEPLHKQTQHAKVWHPGWPNAACLCVACVSGCRWWVWACTWGPDVGGGCGCAHGALLRSFLGPVAPYPAPHGTAQLRSS